MLTHRINKFLLGQIVSGSPRFGIGRQAGGPPEPTLLGWGFFVVWAKIPTLAKRWLGWGTDVGRMNPRLPHIRKP